jgi:hypothetical protein
VIPEGTTIRKGDYSRLFQKCIMLNNVANQGLPGRLDCLGSASPYSLDADDPHPSLVVAPLLTERGTGRNCQRKGFIPEPISGEPVMGFLLSVTKMKEQGFETAI